MKTGRTSALIGLATAAALCAAPVAAQDLEFSLYSGWQTAPHSRVKGDYPGTGADFDALIGWDGKSFEMPPYYGIRGTWWRSENVGFGLEFTHTKVYAPDDEKAAIGFDDLEFTDGLNIVTANALYRWPNRWGSVTPYVGGGIGISVPHVDVDSTNGFETYELQYAGPAARLMAGASYDLTERVSVFGEYQFTYSSNDVDLEGEGSLQSDIKTNAVNFGVTLKF
ncbi:outer membrane protein [Roseivivax isoporae]|uniref:Lipid A oxidase (Involved in formation of 2-aminogluconate) protein n=1 Tax=Roseivivax isoporae LMG 25204 TaxID=1449351 RepID=X7FFS0_9RHOB|nr:outer membrane beta-barrel protein [Roseivivax isoporae]ETX30911.1 lipid A oxidase (Involved in formation of 2-aminogluconate) protein [Roseivivax isoporae LMG 25204]